ncbi:MAG: hypothetical protein QM627_00075 [Luteolibacter sp.]
MSTRPIWNAENGRPVKWETLHLILTVGMKIRPASEEYKLIHDLWLEQRQQQADTKPATKYKQLAPVHEISAVAAFRRAIKGLTKSDVKKIVRNTKAQAFKMRTSKNRA